MSLMKKDLNYFSTLFKALGDMNRLSMLRHICSCSAKKQPANVSELSSCCDIDLSVVSRHLAKLKAAGVLKANKNGKEVNYDVNSEELVKSLRELADFIEETNKCC